MKLGIYGGSFNPPHNMHLKMATELINNKILDKVIFVPTGSKYPKSGLINNKYRLEMIKLMINNIPNLDVSDYELKDNQVYTYETLNHFKKLYPNDEIYFILGSDLYKDFSSWNNSEYILNNFKILVTLRDEDKKEELEKINLSNKDNIIYTNISLDSLSSTEIRDKIKNKDIAFLEENMNYKIIEYIEKNHLYEGEGLC